MINNDRLAATFRELVEIDSVSREERAVSERIQEMLTELGATITIDSSNEKTGSDTGNLVAAIPGTVNVPPMLLSGHMDTVEPGKGIRAVLKDGVFYSEGATILGADDKSAIAIILETLRVLKENAISHGPIEIVFTVCEEIGLLGAKHFDVGLIESKFGYILDSTDSEGIVTRAPFANRFAIRLFGKAAHAGAVPEKGISTIKLASQAIAGLDLGRIDHETTCNIGKITGGVATNVVPELTVIDGEARSHSLDKLERVMDTIISAFNTVIDDYKNAHPGTNGLPRIEVDVERDFPGTNIPDDHTVVRLARQAAERIGLPMETKSVGGGADANIFFEKGIVTGVLGTGMKNIHTHDESIALADMVRSVELLIEIIRIHSES